MTPVNTKMNTDEEEKMKEKPMLMEHIPQQVFEVWFEKVLSTEIINVPNNKKIECSKLARQPATFAWVDPVKDTREQRS